MDSRKESASISQVHYSSIPAHSHKSVFLFFSASGSSGYSWLDVIFIFSPFAQKQRIKEKQGMIEDEALKKGMEEKSKEFKEKGSEVYL